MFRGFIIVHFLVVITLDSLLDNFVEEITTALAEANFNLEQMETWRESASMAGYELFIAQMAVRLSGDASTDDLEAVLEDVSDDLMVSIVT